ncbi:MAG: hypothetical protein ACFE85_15710 [Candidatus Hodarchaeota archaeon]
MLRKTILFDLSHNEMLNIEEQEFSNLLNLLQSLNLKIKKNENRNLTKKVLDNVDILVIGNPIDDYFSNIEIKEIVDFVRNGGGTLLISEYGADYLQKTNLNDISATHFGIHFEKNIVKRSTKDDQNSSSIVKIYNSFNHEITNSLREIVIGGSCSLFLDKEAEALLKVVRKNVWTEIFNGSTNKWIKDQEQEQIIAACTEFGQGKVVAFGDIDIFCNGSNFGINSFDNQKLIENTVNWLIEPVKKSDVITFMLNQLGDLQNSIKEMTITINNIIETMTILEKRISYLEDITPVLNKSKEQESSQEE